MYGVHTATVEFFLRDEKYTFYVMFLKRALAENHA